MSSTKSYYVDINRFSAQDSESDTTNIWDYSLNDTIVAPAGSEVSIHQAFINQKGITGQSIEIEDDINETINYYAYISEQDHSVPCVGSPYNKKQGKRFKLNGHYDTHLDLLNNADTAGGSGRTSLWGFTPPIGTASHLESYNFGGSGAPLILSSKPDFDLTQSFTLNVSCVNPLEAVWNGVVSTGGTDGLVHTINGSPNIVFSSALNGLIRVNALIEAATAGSSPTGITAGTRIQSIDTAAGTAVMTANSSNTGDHQMRIRNSGNGYDEGQHIIYGLTNYPIVSDGRKVEVGMRCRFTTIGTKLAGEVQFNPNALATVSQNYNLQVKSIAADGNSCTIGEFASPANTTTKDVIIKSQNNVAVDFSTDPNYYLTPVVLTNNIFIKKGTYGIEQLITIINNQFNGLYKDKSQIPTNPITEALIAQDWNGLLNSTENGLTKVIKPIAFTSPPDNVAIARINPLLIDTLSDNFADHCFVSAYDYSGLRNSNQLEPNKYNFTENVLGTGSTGFVGYIQNNDIVNFGGIDGTANTIADGSVSLAFTTDGTPSGLRSGGVEAKKIADYQIIRGYSIGAPEFNIQYDTDLSAFSLNNLHSSYRIASHDKQGNPNTSSGEVAVGVKSVCDIVDAVPWSLNQSIYGNGNSTTNSGDNVIGVMAGKTQAGTNVINDIQQYQNVLGTGTYVSDLFDVSINALITQTSSAHASDFPTGGEVRVVDYYSFGAGGLDPKNDQKDVFSFICDLPVNASTNNNGTFSNSREINFLIQGHAVPVATQKLMKQSFEKPLSRNGGVIVHNFAFETALKYGDRRSVVDKEIYNPHASFSEFFSSETQARKIWKTKTLWGKLGFTYEQLNDPAYFENIIQYTNPTDRKLRGITTDTQVDLSTIPTISTQNNPSNQTIDAIYGGAQLTHPQNFNNFDTNRPRTAFQRQWEPTGWAGGSAGNNNFQYSGSPYNMATCINVLSKPTPIAAQELPTLSRFGYYLITSDLVPTYKDIVAKGDPLGLLGVVPKTSLSSQDFIPLASSDLVQVLNQDTNINNIRVKILNPDLSNPDLSKNSAIILRIDTPIQQPTKNTEEETKTPKKK